MKIRPKQSRLQSLCFSTVKGQWCFWGAIILLFLTLVPMESYGGSGLDQGSRGQRIPVQRGPNPYPYPQPYPPPYYPPPSPDSIGGSRQARPSGWINVEVEPKDAEVFLDGNKMDLAENNSYEEGVLVGKHRIEVKKEGYLDHLEFVEVQAAVKQRLKIRLNKIK